MINGGLIYILSVTKHGTIFSGYTFVDYLLDILSNFIMLFVFLLSYMRSLCILL